MQAPFALPPEVVALARRCGADSTGSKFSRATLRQTGTLRSDAAAPWRPFRARQTIALDRPGFEWRATMGPLGAIAVTDALDDVGPRLTVIALGMIQIARPTPDEALTKGELLRYLAELPLAPDAILRNAALEWTVLTPTLLRVAASHLGVHGQVDLELDADGLVISAFARDRPRLEAGRTVERPWRGRFSDYRLHSGHRLPFAAEVAWTIDGQEVPVWRGRMEDWALS